MDWEHKTYSLQRYGAKRRGIRWRFTFQDWIAWWEKHLGPDWIKKRGRLAGQYVMARKNDCGPYSPINCRCITNCENGQEAHKGKPLSSQHRQRISAGAKGNVVGEHHGRHKLTTGKVITIFYSDIAQHRLAKRYHVNQSTISLIKAKKTWVHITKDL